MFIVFSFSDQYVAVGRRYTGCLTLYSVTANKFRYLRFEVLMATDTEIGVFRDLAPCSLLDRCIGRRFRIADDEDSKLL
jgi:hypothetical protein